MKKISNKYLVAFIFIVAVLVVSGVVYINGGFTKPTAKSNKNIEVRFDDSKEPLPNKDASINENKESYNCLHMGCNDFF